MGLPEEFALNENARHWLVWLVLTLAVLDPALGCREANSTDVVVELRSSEEAEIVSRVAKIQIWFDAEGGFQGMGPSTQVDGFQVSDLDEDGLPELLLEMSIQNRRLPKVRLAPGSNQGKSISIQAMGLDADENLVAIGGTSPQVLFIPSQRKTIQVPFERIGTTTNPGSFPQIRLEPQPLFNSAAQVLQPINTIEVVLDLPGGIDDQDAFISKFTRKDVDSDGELELLQEIPWSGQSTFPEIALDVAITPSKKVRVNVRGLTAQGQVAAYGGAGFIYGTRQEIKIPFNLSRTFLAPRIVGFAPLNFPKQYYPSSLAFYASKKLNPESVPQNIHFIAHLSSGTTTEINVNLESRDCPFGTQMWKATPKECWGTGSFVTLTGVELVIDPKVTDINGVALVPYTPVRFQLSLSGVYHVGPCVPLRNCEDKTGEYHPLDAVCNTSTHMFDPAPCGLSPGAPNCQNERDGADWAHPDSQALCTQWNPSTTLVQGSCAFDKAPYPCGNSCPSVGQSCQDNCPDDSLLCAGGQGCLPRLMGCAENCIIFGGCPDPRQICTKITDTAYLCR